MKSWMDFNLSVSDLCVCGLDQCLEYWKRSWERRLIMSELIGTEKHAILIVMPQLILLLFLFSFSLNSHLCLTTALSATLLLLLLLLHLISFSLSLSLPFFQFQIQWLLSEPKKKCSHFFHFIYKSGKEEIFWLM